jgi:threonine aldolase
MLAAANPGDTVAYGADPWTERATSQLRELFGARGGVFFVFTGTAANVLGLGLLLRPYEGVVCPASSHLNVDECGAVERVLGCKLLSVPAPDGKLTPELVASRLADRGDEHRVQPGVVAVAQATELGTCYTLAELRALREFCESQRLLLYLDGARLANAAAYLGCSLAELAGCADVLSFGATKNGALGAEAVVVMADGLDGAAPYLRKQHMQLGSKMRYLAAQFCALLADGLWLRNAQQANAMARRLADGLHDVAGVSVCQPVMANMVFAEVTKSLLEPLRRDWHFDSAGDASVPVARWMTAFNTTEADVDDFLAAVRKAAGQS